MRYDRDLGPAADRGRGARRSPREYGDDREGPAAAPWPRHDWGMGYRGGALRSRGSWDPRADFGRDPGAEEFRWGAGYVGGRGYGGTNFDYEHGYRTGGSRAPGGFEESRSGARESPATRGGYGWGDEVSPRGQPYGPARYGLGPYYERLRRRRRDDDEVREDVLEALFYDTWVDADAITVRVEKGIVTLEGSLPNYDEVRFAVEDAWDVDGVQGVRTELEVDGTGRPSQRGGRRSSQEEEEDARGPDVREGAEARATQATDSASTQPRGRSGGRQRSEPAPEE